MNRFYESQQYQASDYQPVSPISDERSVGGIIEAIKHNPNLKRALGAVGALGLSFAAVNYVESRPQLEPIIRLDESGNQLSPQEMMSQFPEGTQLEKIRVSHGDNVWEFADQVAQSQNVDTRAVVDQMVDANGGTATIEIGDNIYLAEEPDGTVHFLGIED